MIIFGMIIIILACQYGLRIEHGRIQEKKYHIDYYIDEVPLVTKNFFLVSLHFFLPLPTPHTI